MNRIYRFAFNNELLRKIFFKNLLKRLTAIKLLVFDVDGVLTDGSIFIANDGTVTKKFNVKDGLGLKILLEEGLKIIFLSGSNSNSIKIRAEQLGITKCVINAKDKVKEIKALQNELGFRNFNTAFVGDDLNDLKVKKYVSVFISPLDAITEIRNNSDIVLQTKGGFGAAREVAEILLKVNKLIDFYKSFGWVDKNDV